jgi:hypothetical protein
MNRRQFLARLAATTAGATAPELHLPSTDELAPLTSRGYEHSVELFGTPSAPVTEDDIRSAQAEVSRQYRQHSTDGDATVTAAVPRIGADERVVAYAFGISADGRPNQYVGSVTRPSDVLVLDVSSDGTFELGDPSSSGVDDWQRAEERAIDRLHALVDELGPAAGELLWDGSDVAWNQHSSQSDCDAYVNDPGENVNATVGDQVSGRLEVVDGIAKHTCIPPWGDFTMYADLWQDTESFRVYLMQRTRVVPGQQIPGYDDWWGSVWDVEHRQDWTPGGGSSSASIVQDQPPGTVSGQSVSVTLGVSGKTPEAAIGYTYQIPGIGVENASTTEQAEWTWDIHDKGARGDKRSFTSGSVAQVVDEPRRSEVRCETEVVFGQWDWSIDGEKFNRVTRGFTLDYAQIWPDDSDGDGLPDDEDPAPHDPDADDDGLQDGRDDQPLDPDMDDDGAIDGNDPNPRDPDVDDDGVEDGADPAPRDPDVPGRGGGGGDGERDLGRFDLNDNHAIDGPEVSKAIAAYNSGGEIGGEPVSREDIQRLIQAYNEDEYVP